MEKQTVILLTILILLISGIGVYWGFFYEKPDTSEFPLDATCSYIYLDICYNQSSPAYGCNMFTQTCDDDEFKLATIVAVMEEYEITIYGATWCPFCVEQLEDFGKYSDYLLENGIFVYCDEEPIDPECNTLTNVPAWKQGGKIVQEGYMDIKQLVSNINGSINT